MLKKSLAHALLSAAALLVSKPAMAHDGEVHRQGQTGDLRDLVADLYGGNGITLDPDVVFHAAHFSASSQEQLNDLSRVIASGVSSFTFNSSVSSISFDFDKGYATRTQDSLGPLMAERPSTVGRGKFNLGVSYTNVHYKRLNGQNLSDLQITLEHDQVTGEPYEKDVIVLDLDLDIKQQIVAFYGAYGVTKNLDIGVVIPLQKMEGSVTSVARIINNGGNGIHQFGGNVSPISTNNASATGIGDVLIRAKWNLSDMLSSGVDTGLLLQGRIPTGDEADLLGAGRGSIYFAGLLSKSFGRFTPHLNVGYEKFFNNDDGIERSNLRAVAGFDVKADENLSVASEVIGRWEDDGDKFYDLALGAKWAPIGNVPISANIVVPLNRNEGLRPNLYFTLGIEATF